MSVQDELLQIIEKQSQFIQQCHVSLKQLNCAIASQQQTIQQQHTVEYGLVMAGATISAVPMILIFLIFQKQIVKGLTAGAVKG